MRRQRQAGKKIEPTLAMQAQPIDLLTEGGGGNSSTLNLYNELRGKAYQQQYKLYHTPDYQSRANLPIKLRNGRGIDQGVTVYLVSARFDASSSIYNREELVNMSTYTSPDQQAKTTQSSPNTLTDDQRMNARKVLRRLARGQRPALPLPDMAGLNAIIPDLIDALNEDGIRGVRNACAAMIADYPIIPLLLQESRYKFLSINDLINLPDQAYLVDGLLYEDATSVFYGLPGCNKSFITVGIAACMALGWHWNGRATKRCRIIYIAAEGARGYRRRILAFCKANNIDSDRLMNNILFLPREVELFDAAAVEEFTAELKLTVEEVEEDTGERLPVLIVIDTVFQCSAGQNLNDTAVMTTLTGAMQRIKRDTGAIHVLAVHHSGKDKERGMSGNIALKANVDSVFIVESDNDGLTKVTNAPPHGKVKDDEPTEFYLQREQVVYGEGPRDNSCVMLPASRPASDDSDNETMRNMLAVLPTDKTLASMAWLKAVNDSQPAKGERNGTPIPYISKSTFLRGIKTAIGMGLVENLGNDQKPAYRRCQPQES